MPTPSSLPRDPKQTPRTRRFLQKLAGAVFNNTLPVPANVALTNAANVFTQQQKINSLYGDIHADADAATITFDIGAFNLHQVTIAGNRTLALTGDKDGQGFEIIIRQGAAAPWTVTWFAGILWPGGTVPTLTVTVNKRDWFFFRRLSSGVYLGITLGLNF